jgi:hypothetical protein
VREAHAATSERGFHKRLTEFLGWTLPLAPRFNDVDCPLYLETIFPLLYVEQKLGWGRLPAIPLGWGFGTWREGPSSFCWGWTPMRLRLRESQYKMRSDVFVRNGQVCGARPTSSLQWLREWSGESRPNQSLHGPPKWDLRSLCRADRIGYNCGLIWRGSAKGLQRCKLSLFRLLPPTTPVRVRN